MLHARKSFFPVLALIVMLTGCGKGKDQARLDLAQLDALEAFQKSLGRRQDLDLSTLVLKSELAKKGQQIFLNPGNVLNPAQSNAGAGKCFICHLNAGASDFFFPGANANFNTNAIGTIEGAVDFYNSTAFNQAPGFGALIGGIKLEPGRSKPSPHS